MGPHDGHRQRLKTEFLARPDSFPDHKLLELLLLPQAARDTVMASARAMARIFFISDCPPYKV